MPLVENGAEKDSAVYLGKHCHYRRTASTTMTFAAKAATLLEARDDMVPFVDGTHPHDFYLFLCLAAFHGMRVVHTLPAVSTHGETAYLAPFVRWTDVSTKVTIPLVESSATAGKSATASGPTVGTYSSTEAEAYS